MNIKELDLHCSAFSDDSAARFLEEMFPSIEKLGLLYHMEVEDILFRCVWEHWADLKKLEVRCGYRNANFDSIFCGIFPEKVAELGEKDDDYLKRVNIVTVMPAFTCLRNLRTFTLYIESFHLSPVINDPTFIFTKVTGLIAFARCPSLEVTLQTDSPQILEAMSHVNPCMSVVLQKRNLIQGIGT